jgi:preprotein translocase subunit SecF
VSTVVDDTTTPAPPERSVWHRLYAGETTYDFYGKRWRGFGLSLALIVIALVSLATRQLNLGIDFEGGVAWEVPAAGITIDEAEGVLSDNGIDVADAKIQTLGTGSDQRLRIQVGEQPADVQAAVAADLAEAAEVDVDEVSAQAVSSSWGRSITEKAVRALVVFFILVSVFIAWRFEWKMALSAFLAMVHDVLISVGVYSVLGLVVTPATVVAFLTILGYSLYDTIVVFDRVRDNAKRFSGSRTPYADVINVSMNQVLMRSLNTSICALLPVFSLWIVGSIIMGARSLEEFALALLVGLLAGAYSSIFIATPLLAVLKEREPKYRSLRSHHATGDELARLMGHGQTVGRREHGAATSTGDAEADALVPGRATATVAPGTVELDTTAVLSHPPRPRKKKRR